MLAARVAQLQQLLESPQPLAHTLAAQHLLYLLPMLLICLTSSSSSSPAAAAAAAADPRQQQQTRSLAAATTISFQTDELFLHMLDHNNTARHTFEELQLAYDMVAVHKERAGDFQYMRNVVRKAKGRGILISAGGRDMFANAFVHLKV